MANEPLPIVDLCKNNESSEPQSCVKRHHGRGCSGFWSADFDVLVGQACLVFGSPCPCRSSESALQQWHWWDLASW